MFFDTLDRVASQALLGAASRIGGMFTKSDESNISNPRNWLIAAFGGGPTRSGMRITPANALTNSAVMKCVRVIGESVANLPVFVYQRTEGASRQPDTDHRLYRVLHDAPNRRYTSFDWRYSAMAHLLLRGNSYAIISRDNRGRAVGLTPVRPDNIDIQEDVQPERNELPMLFYSATPSNYQSMLVPEEDMLHVRGLTTDGIKGLSPVGLARESIGLSQAGEAHGAHVFSNGAHFSGAVKIPTLTNDTEREAAQRRFNEAFTGVERAGMVPVFDGELDFVKLSMSNDDAQWLESRRFQARDIYGIYGVPPHMVGDTEASTSWGTGIEQQTIGFVTFTLLAWVKRWEQRLNMALLTDAEKQTHFIEFSLNNILRGDQKTRFLAYALGRQWGWLSVNDIRRLENLNPIGPAGDRYLEPLNMANAQDLIAMANGSDNASGQQAVENIADEAGLMMAKLLQSAVAKVSGKVNGHA